MGRNKHAAAREVSTPDPNALIGTCIAPRCKAPVIRQFGVGLNFHMCAPHLVVIWELVERKSHEPWFEPVYSAVKERLAAERRAVAAQDEAEDAQMRADLNDGRIPGSIYFVRVNGLIKVGWSGDVEKRLKAYGPEIEILCVYPGTRQDETNLHRQLTPSRASGREWYHDDQILGDYVKDAVAIHGPPTITVNWTKPKQQATKPRYWAA